MAYTLGNKCAKNLCKRYTIIENVVTCFFGTQCTYTYTPCPEKNGTNNILGITLTNTNV